MARPRTFDEDVVLNRALEAFWASGYAATSLTDLEAATGLAKGSLYKAFGDKRALFLRTLDRYLDEGQRAVRAMLSREDSPAAGLEGWLRSVAAQATAPARRGCFAGNCTVELGPSDEQVRDRLLRHTRVVEGLYADAVRRGIEAGEFDPQVAPEMAARFVSGVVYGLQVLGKASLDPAEAEGMVLMTLRALR